jgi:peptidoglycan hydrolase CwlO-like protein
MEMKSNEQHMSELESKIAVLSQELVRLNEVLRDR